MTIRGSSGYLRTLLLLPLLLLTLLQLTGCGDKEPDQRKAFIQFLQNTVLPGGERLPALSDAQKEQFGTYAGDYQILATFSDQFTRAVNSTLVPVLDEISQIRVPQDYLAHRETLQQSAGALNMLTPQLVSNRKQADDARGRLKQPEDLQAVYSQAYEKLVSQPVARVTPVIGAASTLSATLIQVGNFLNAQNGQVTYGTGTLAFPTQLQATQYNELMKGLQSQHQQLLQAQATAGNLLP